MTNETKFDQIIDTIRRSPDLTKDQIKYLENKLEKKEKWAKYITKEQFTAGVSTTSRVEGLHSVQKKYLTSSSSLKKVFYSFRSLEKQQITRFQEEFNEKSKNLESINGIASLKVFKEDFSSYVYIRIAAKYKLAIDYIKENTNNSKTW